MGTYHLSSLYFRDTEMDKFDIMGSMTLGGNFLFSFLFFCFVFYLRGCIRFVIWGPTMYIEPDSPDSTSLSIIIFGFLSSLNLYIYRYGCSRMFFCVLPGPAGQNSLWSAELSTQCTKPQHLQPDPLKPQVTSCAVNWMYIMW